MMFDGSSGKVAKDAGYAFSTDTALAANSDSLVVSQKAIKNYLNQLIGLFEIDESGNLMPRDTDRTSDSLWEVDENNAIMAKEIG